MQNGFVETLIGAAVVIVAAAFFYYGWNTTDSGTVIGYQLVAKFDRIDGVGVGTDVRMSGIKIGTVTSEALDPKTYRAVVGMSIKREIALPQDSSIKVASEGLLGGSYLSVAPGGSDDTMKEGAEFEITQGSIDLLGLISKAMFSGGDDANNQSSPGASPPTEPAAPSPASP